MAAETIGTAQVELSVDESGVEAGVAKAKRTVASLGEAAARAGKDGSKGLGDLGKGGEQAAGKLDAATKRAIASIERQTLALGKSKSEYYAAAAAINGTEKALAPYIAKLAEAERAQKKLGDSTSGLRSAAGSLAGVAAALGLTLSVSTFTGWIKGSIDAADALNDLSEQTGIAASNLSAYQYAAKLSGTSLDTLGAGFKALAKNMSDGDGAFKAMGISIKDAAGRLRSTDEVLQDVADRFSTYEDGAAKAALAMQLFGKAGVEMIPFLNNGRAGLVELREEAEALGVVLSDKAVKQAGAFNDQLDRLGSAGSGFSAALSAELLPTLTAVADELLGASKQGEGFALVAEGLGDIFKALTAGGYSVALVFDQIGSYIGAGVAYATVGTKAFGDLSEALERFRRFDFSGGRESLDSAKSNYDRLGGIYESWLEDTASKNEKFVARMRRLFQDQVPAAISDGASDVNRELNRYGSGIAGAGDKIAAPLISGIKGANKQVESEFSKLSASINSGYLESIRTITPENANLTKSEQALVSIVHEKAKVWDALSPKEQDAIRRTIALTAANERSAAAMKISAEVAKDYAAWIRVLSEADAGESQSDRTKRQAAEVKGLADAYRDASRDLATFGMSRVELAEYEAELTRAAIEQEKLRLEMLGVSAGTELKYLEDRLELQEKLAGVSGRRDAAEKADAANKKILESWNRTVDNMDASFREGLGNMLDRGEDGFKDWAKNIWRTLQIEFLEKLYQATLRPFVLQVVAGMTGNNSALQAASSVFGGGNGGGFDISSISSWVSAGKSLWSGFSNGGFSGALSSFGTMFSGATTAYNSFTASEIAAWMAANGGAPGATAGVASTAGASGSSSLAAAWPLAVLAGMKASADAYDAGFRDPKHSTFGNGIGGAIGKAIHDTSAGPLFGNVLGKLFGEKTAGVITGGPLVSMLMSKITGETRGGGQYGYAFDGFATNARRGTQVAGTGVTFLEGPSGGELAGTQVRQAIDMTVTSINGVLKALGSSASLAGFQAGVETSDKGRGGVFSGGKLSTGATFGESGAGSNYDGTLFEKTSSQSVNAEQALANFGTDLLQVTIQALQAATDIPKAISDKLKGVNAESLTTEAAQALLDDINKQIVLVGAFGEAVKLMPFDNLRDLSFDATTRLIELAGGIEGLAGGTQSFFQNFFTAEEQRAQLLANTNAALDKVGGGFEDLDLSAEDARDQFKQLVLAIDVTTEAGAAQFAAALAAADSVSQLVAAYDQQTNAASLLADRRQLEIALMEAQGNTAGALAARRADELAAMDESLRGLQEMIYAAQDLTAATKTARDAQKALTERYAAPLTVDGAFKQITAQLGNVGDLSSLLAHGADRLKQSIADLAASINPADTAGQSLIATLNGLTGAFDVVIDASATLASNQAASAAEAAQAALDRANQVYRANIEAERASLTAGYGGSVAQVNAQIERLNGSVGNLKSLSDLLDGALNQNKLDRFPEYERAVAQSQLSASLAIAKAGGPLPAAETFKDIVATLSKPAGDLFADYVSFARDQGRTAGELAELSGLTDKQLTLEELSLKALDTQLEMMQRDYEAQMQRLDGLLSVGVDQAEMLGLINGTVGGLAASLGAVQVANRGVQASNIISGLGRTPGESQISAALKEGRSLGLSVAELVAAWNAANPSSPTSVAGIEEFARKLGIPGYALGGVHGGGVRLVGERGPELELTGAARYYTAEQTRRLMSGQQGNDALLAEMREMRKELAALKSTMARGADGSARTAELLNNISGGGGPLLVETA